METPPRAWGRLYAGGRKQDLMRNTPTCVGKTSKRRPIRMGPWKHPHVRGEDVRVVEHNGEPWETPPRAWGRHAYIDIDLLPNRNTPTCVGKTDPRRDRFLGKQKHPHVRGEDHLPRSPGQETGETPPRAWGRPPSAPFRSSPPRNTPTCVGKTPCAVKSFRRLRKHPHVRGEDLMKRDLAARHMETPPRAWGRP